MVRITEAPISAEEALKEVSSPGAGAIVTFTGTVRDHSRGRKVRHLFYEAYQEMAEAKMREIEAEVLERWDLERVAIIHRVGCLEIGEISVVIAIASAHREEAFEACRYAIDALKVRVPIWKKEVYLDGEAWIEG